MVNVGKYTKHGCDGYPKDLTFFRQTSPSHIFFIQPTGTKFQRIDFSGCSLSAAIALLWPHGLGLYRLSARDALFVRGDVAQETLECTPDFSHANVVGDIQRYTS